MYVCIYILKMYVYVYIYIHIYIYIYIYTYIYLYIYHMYIHVYIYTVHMHKYIYIIILLSLISLIIIDLIIIFILIVIIIIIIIIITIIITLYIIYKIRKAIRMWGTLIFFTPRLSTLEEWGIVNCDQSDSLQHSGCIAKELTPIVFVRRLATKGGVWGCITFHIPVSEISRIRYNTQ